MTIPQPPPAATLPSSPPTSAIGAPAAQLAPLAPLSPQQPANILSGGGVPKQGTLALSPGSPSEQAPSAPGGGGKTLKDCMGFWDSATHMTKAEWRAACQRSLTRLDNLKLDELTTPPKKK
jgi:hypothetical protein